MRQSPKFQLLLLAFAILPFDNNIVAQKQATPYQEYDDNNNDAEELDEEDDENQSITYPALPVPLPTQHRALKDQDWKQLTKDPIFNYQEKQLKPAPSVAGSNWWLKILSRLLDFFMSFMGKIIIWILVALLVLTLFFRILQMKGNIFFSRKDKKIAIPKNEEIEEDFVPQNWEIAIEEAINSGDYRLAARFAYRYLLFLLAEKEMIRYEKAKTNLSYSKELAHASFHKKFMQTTLFYEYAWYGAFEIEQKQFDQYFLVIREIKSELR